MVERMEFHKILTQVIMEYCSKSESTWKKDSVREHDIQAQRVYYFMEKLFKTQGSREKEDKSEL